MVEITFNTIPRYLQLVTYQYWNSIKNGLRISYLYVVICQLWLCAYCLVITCLILLFEVLPFECSDFNPFCSNFIILNTYLLCFIIEVSPWNNPLWVGNHSRFWLSLLCPFAYMHPQILRLFGFPIFWLSAYPIKGVPEVRYAHLIRYLRF